MMDITQLTDGEMERMIKANLFHPLNSEGDGLIWPNYRYLTPDFPPYAKTYGAWRPTGPIPNPNRAGTTTVAGFGK